MFCFSLSLEENVESSSARHSFLFFLVSETLKELWNRTNRNFAPVHIFARGIHLNCSWSHRGNKLALFYLKMTLACRKGIRNPFCRISSPVLVVICVFTALRGFLVRNIDLALFHISPTIILWIICRLKFVAILPNGLSWYENCFLCVFFASMKFNSCILFFG